jgi:cation transport ATPase
MMKLYVHCPLRCYTYTHALMRSLRTVFCAACSAAVEQKMKACTLVRKRTRAHTHTQTHTCTHTHTQTHTCTHTRTHKHTHRLTHAHIHAHTHARIHTYTNAPAPADAQSEASEQLGVPLPREKKKHAYNKALVNRFKHMPDIKKITRHRHVPAVSCFVVCVSFLCYLLWFPLCYAMDSI